MLKQTRVNKHDLKSTLNDASNLLDQLETTSDKLECDIFKNVVVKFERAPKELDAKEVGSVKFQDYQLYFVENLENIREVALHTRIDDITVEPESERTFNLTLSPFKTRNLVFAYINKQNNMSLTCMERDGTILNEKKNIIKSLTLTKITYFAIQTLSNFLFIYTEEIHNDQAKTLFMLRNFDENLNLIKQVKG